MPEVEGGWWRRLWRYVGALFPEFWTLRSPIFWAIIIAIGMIAPAQVKELYLINAEQVAPEGGISRFLTVEALGRVYLQLIMVAALVFWLRLCCFQLLNPAKADSMRGFFALNTQEVVRPSWVSLMLCALPQFVLFWMTYQRARGNGVLAHHEFTFWMLFGFQAFFVAASLGFLVNLTPLATGRLAGWLFRKGEVFLGWLNRLTPFNIFGLGGLVASLAIPLILAAVTPFGGVFVLALLLIVFNLPYRPVTFWVFALVLFGSVVILCADPVGAGPLLGPLGLLSLFACCLVFITSALSVIEDRLHFPASPVVVGCALAFSVLDLNDNHSLNTVEARPLTIAAGEGRTDLQRAFEAWLVCRPGYAEAVARQWRYPVYLVAAQGGGLYAAYQSASFLSAVQDRSPGFRDHIFAASGVSGGSVGVTVFSALAGLDASEAIKGPCADPGPVADSRPISPLYLDKVNAALRNDFLSPVGAALLFPDMLARLAFWPVEWADRVGALEQSFADAFRAATGSDLLNAPVLEGWTPEGHMPLLLLNTIDVDTGRRMVVTPIAELGTVATIRDVLACGQGAALCPSPTYASGMLLSARFPLVTPAGSVPMPERADSMHPDYWANHQNGMTKARFVDGGYYENSGLDTVADLINELRRLPVAANVVFRVINFDQTPPAFPKRSYWLGEIASPVRALNSSRSARIEPARDRILNIQGGTWVDLISIRLDDRQDEFPLGWALSDYTFKRIACDLFDDLACAAIQSDAYSGRNIGADSPALENRRRMSLIISEISNPSLRAPPTLAAPVTKAQSAFAR